MKRRVVYFLFCLCFCFSTLSLSSSAVEYDPYTGFEFDFDTDKYYDPYTGQEMIYDAAGDYFYAVHEPLEYEPFELFRLSSPNYPDFNINNLPWLEMPSYVQDILYNEPKGLVNDSEYSGEYKLPFVMVTVTSSYVSIYAGYNLCIGTYYSSSSATPNYALIAIKYHQKIYENSVCYKATYSREYKLTDPWSVYEPVAHGDNYVRYTYLNYSDASRDYYFYGSSGMYAGRTQQTLKINDSADQYPQYRYVNNPTSGFASGTIIYAADNWAGYITSFAPPTADQIENSTNKGIWESIKELPTKIADSIKGFFTSLGDRISGFFNILAEKIKSFFLPSYGYFDDYVEDFQNYFKDRFGLLYELPDAVIDILQQFIDYSPEESEYFIDVPDVVMPVYDNGEWYDAQIIDATTISFDFLEQGAFKTLYSLYRSVVWMIFIFALINLIIRKSEQVFGGSG